MCYMARSPRQGASEVTRGYVIIMLTSADMPGPVQSNAHPTELSSPVATQYSCISCSVPFIRGCSGMQASKQG